MAKKKKSQTTLRSKKFGRQVLKASTRQTGKSHTKRDSARKAMQPGKRRSASGRVYYEHRKTDPICAAGEPDPPWRAVARPLSPPSMEKSYRWFQIVPSLDETESYL